MRLLSSVHIDEDVEKIVSSIQTLKINEAEVVIEGDKETIRKDLLPSLQAKLGVSPQLVAATGEYLNYLVAQSAEWPQGDERFLAATTDAFRLARERSVENDPLMENRAALLALGILLGHHRVADIVGSRDAVRHLSAAKQQIGRVTIRDRSDWTKHFCVSAALVVLADETTSDLLGVLKEEMDSGGGSGFSFGDLLADRAGTMFAEAATHDAASARRFQNNFTGDVRIDDIFPPAADLPEGLQGRELQTRFGGIGGRGYRKVEQDINRRLQNCILLRK